jgi:hypothetical protein
LIYGEIKEEDILSVLTLDHFLENLPRLPDNNDPFGLRNLQSPNPLRNVRRLIKENALHMKFSTGHIVGELLQTLKLPIEYLNDGASVIVRDWAFKKNSESRKNEAFKKGVFEGYLNGRANHVKDSDLLGHSSRFMKSLQEAVRGLDEENNSFEEPSDDDFEELCSCPDTLRGGDFSDYEMIQAPMSTRFVQELYEAAEPMNSISGQESEPHYLGDMVTDLEDILNITPGNRLTMKRASFTGSGKRLVPYSDSEGDNMTEDGEVDLALVDDEM